MKKNLLIYISIFLFACACGDKWDDYYHGGSASTETVLDITLTEFFDQNKEYSEFYNLLQACKLDTVLEKDQQLTLWIVDNENIASSGVTQTDTLRMQYHMNHLPFLTTDLKEGLRIRTLNGIYVQIGKKDESTYVNNSKILESFRLKNGVIHVIDELMMSKINLFDFIASLPDEYSMFRDSLMALNEDVFDRENSDPVSVDITGNTIYDSVFYVYNPVFEKAPFNSEFRQFTAFIPNNAVLDDCFNKLKTQFASMGETVTLEDTVAAMKWIREAAFYDGIITDFTPTDLKSSFGRVWRNPIQKVDQTNVVEMSNGVLYYVTDMKIPTNYILDRVKSLVEYYQYLTEEEQKDEVNFYKFMNATSVKVATDAATPKPDILPFYVYLSVDGDQNTNEEFSVEFPPLEKYTKEDGSTHARIMSVPNGEYDLYLGFRSSGHPYVNAYFNGQLLATNLAATLSTPWNFDRVTETEADRIPGGKAKWDGLGGYVGKVRVGEEGVDGMSSFRIKVEFSKPEAAGGMKRLSPYHWSLKPSDSNY